MIVQEYIRDAVGDRARRSGVPAEQSTTLGVHEGQATTQDVDSSIDPNLELYPLPNGPAEDIT